jgi:hypothetical protein
VQRVSAGFVHPDFAGLSQNRQAEGADAGVEFSDSSALRNLSAHMLNDFLCDIEIVLPEGARRVVNLRSAKMFDHAGGTAPVLEVGAENGVGSFAIAVEP